MHNTEFASLCERARNIYTYICNVLCVCFVLSFVSLSLSLYVYFWYVCAYVYVRFVAIFLLLLLLQFFLLHLFMHISHVMLRSVLFCSLSFLLLRVMYVPVFMSRNDYCHYTIDEAKQKQNRNKTKKQQNVVVGFVVLDSFL